MLSFAYDLAKPFLFMMDAEKAHTLTLSMAGRFGTMIRHRAPNEAIAVECAGLRFPSPVGLAAGLDKDAMALPLWERIGFGFAEIGTITPKPQPGNPKPRVHRFPQHRGLVNSMGFPSEGAAEVSARLARLRESGKWPSAPVGVNIGKNKDTTPEDTPADYATCARIFEPFADYLVVNVSSPNTPGLRELARSETLRRILDASVEHAGDTPVFIKVSPDMQREDLSDALEAAAAAGIRGVVASNTTVQRPEGIGEGLAGGLSGEPLRDIAKSSVTHAIDLCKPHRLPVIGVGGITTPQDALDLLDLGCVAVQVYSGLVFAGPALPGRINQALAERMKSLT